ncbi:MAG: tRNA (cytidine(34)-2'-O)-methyltransferase [Hyphomicrobiaceae bacterium]|nr:tRNA (cytidine(34)-2'-O)-methyltransferase [Hyphomicrobiaceae bacterium]
MRLALYQPDIAQNAGTLLRTAACLAVPVDIIQPTGFDMTDRALRRAGLDYLDHVSIHRHESFEAFDVWRKTSGHRLVLVSRHADRSYLEHSYATGDIIMLGRESAGVPRHVHEASDVRIMIPVAAGLRSLNVAVAGAIVIGEALRQTASFPSQPAKGT